MDESNQRYIPGVCNIGEAEIRMRKMVGWAGLAITIMVWAMFAYVGLAAPWFLILFFPASLSAAGFIQGFTRFCAGFGMRGVFNFGPDVGRTDTVIEAEFRAKDRKTALGILADSMLIGILIAALGFFLR